MLHNMSSLDMWGLVFYIKIIIPKWLKIMTILELQPIRSLSIDCHRKMGKLAERELKLTMITKVSWMTGSSKLESLKDWEILMQNSLKEKLICRIADQLATSNSALLQILVLVLIGNPQDFRKISIIPIVSY